MTDDNGDAGQANDGGDADADGDKDADEDGGQENELTTNNRDNNKIESVKYLLFVCRADSNIKDGHV